MGGRAEHLLENSRFEAVVVAESTPACLCTDPIGRDTVPCRTSHEHLTINKLEHRNCQRLSQPHALSREPAVSFHRNPHHPHQHSRTWRKH
jgi:hypothetical protein